VAQRLSTLSDYAKVFNSIFWSLFRGHPAKDQNIATMRARARYGAAAAPMTPKLWKPAAPPTVIEF